MTVDTVVLAHATGELGSWRPLALLGGVFVAAVLALSAFGRPGAHPHPVGRFLLRAPNALERLTSIPGWAAASVATSLLGLLIAGVGFYNDVSWHVDLGRDEVLFTAPHTMIVFGLGLLLGASILGIGYASLQGLPTALRWRGVRVPWSMATLALLGASALSGFPLDELWHRQYGVDVTMWSPTHLLMICGASLSPIAAWLALTEAGVTAQTSGWAKGLRVAAAFLVLGGLSSIQGEFEFGVPQFQLLYLPALIAVAGGIALVATRIALGPGRTFVVAGLSLLLRFSDMQAATGDGHVRPRTAAVYVGSAIAVELAALALGTTRRLRFAIASGAGIATIGLAAEWAWNSAWLGDGAHQAWTTALLPDAVIISAVVGIGASILGAALGGSVARKPGGVGSIAVALAGVLVVGGLLAPLPRRVGDVQANVSVQPAGPGHVLVDVTLDPPEAAQSARWFQTIAWQGGGLVIADMVRRGPGIYTSEHPVPVGGTWKTLVRLHRGAEMMSVPVFLPSDPEIGKPELPAVARTQPFEPEQRYLLREAHAGPPWFAVAAYLIIGAIASAWAAGFGLAATRIPARDPVRAAATGVQGTRRREFTSHAV